MSSGNRGALAAFAGIAALFTAYGVGIYQAALNYPEEERYQPYRYAADTPAEINPALAAQTGSQPLENRAPCEDPKGREESDLCAQWKSANAAEDTAFWDKWGFWITIAATFGLYWQIFLTRKAVEDTGGATEAMVEANKIAAAAQRAWIDIIPSMTVRLNPDGSIYLKSYATHKNVGKSIATRVYTMSRFRAGSLSDIVEAYNELFRDMMKSKGGLTLMPGKHRSGGQTYNGFQRKRIKWDKEGRAFFCIIAIAIYNVEGDAQRRYSRGMFFLRRSDRDIPGRHSMSWDELVGGPIEIDPDGHFDST